MNKSNIIAISTLITVSLLSPTVIADHEKSKPRHRGEYFDTAKVIDVEPIIRHVRVNTPAEQCWNEQIRKPVKRRVQYNQPENVIIGGIVGGIIGHHLGGGRSKPVATAAGTLIGASIGHNASASYVHTGEYTVVNEQHCQVVNQVHTEEQTVGYHVTYRYKGEVFKTRMDQHPGKHIKVKVEVTPVGGGNRW